MDYTASSEFGISNQLAEACFVASSTNGISGFPDRFGLSTIAPSSPKDLQYQEGIEVCFVQTDCIIEVDRQNCGPSGPLDTSHFSMPPPFLALHILKIQH